VAGPQAIVEWFKGSALRPFLDALDAQAREIFLTDYTARIAKLIRPATTAKCCFASRVYSLSQRTDRFLL
jgi:trans-aconitate methyltransferase